MTEQNVGQQMRPYYHGTSLAHADNILKEGMRPGAFLVHRRQLADSYADMAERYHGGGVTVEGHMQGRPHETTGDPHRRGLIEEAKAAGASHVNNRGLITTVEHGSFVPTRLHFPNGDKVDLT